MPITRRVLLVALLIVMGGGVASMDPSATTFTLAVGPVHASDDESSSCYFNIGYGQHATLIAFHPKNMSCHRMRELLGKRVRLQVVLEE